MQQQETSTEKQHKERIKMQQKATTKKQIIRSNNK